MSKHEIWSLKYRPKTINDYVFQDKNQKAQVEGWVKNGFGNLFFSGPAGCGKTTLARILANSIEISEYDLLEINASNHNSIDDMRNKVIQFAETMSFSSPFRLIILDEFDGVSKQGQFLLRSAVEEYSAIDAARFIFICNYRNKIIPALLSRTEELQFHKLDKTEFTARAASILIGENIQFELDVLDNYIRSFYPDLRKTINSLQQNCVDSALMDITREDATSTDDYKIKAVDLFKNKKFKEARELICSQINNDEIDGMWTWMYQNLDLWGETDEQKDQAVLIIRDGLVNHSLVADPEINLAAAFIELSNIE